MVVRDDRWHDRLARRIARRAFEHTVAVTDGEPRILTAAPVRVSCAGRIPWELALPIVRGCGPLDDDCVRVAVFQPPDRDLVAVRIPATAGVRLSRALACARARPYRSRRRARPPALPEATRSPDAVGVCHSGPQRGRPSITTATLRVVLVVIRADALDRRDFVQRAPMREAPTSGPIWTRSRGNPPGAILRLWRHHGVKELKTSRCRAYTA